MIIAATGHRPDKLGGYGDDALARLQALADNYFRKLGAPDAEIEAVSGMAQGWDTAWALAALGLDIPLICAIPFEGQEKPWPAAAQERYHDILAKAWHVQVVCRGSYADRKFQERNVWMVDRCDRLAALWNGSEGGTANCVKYAESKERPIDHLWAQWSTGG